MCEILFLRLKSLLVEHVATRSRKEEWASFDARVHGVTIGWLSVARSGIGTSEPVTYYLKHCTTSALPPDRGYRIDVPACVDVWSN